MTPAREWNPGRVGGRQAFFTAPTLFPGYIFPSYKLIQIPLELCKSGAYNQYLTESEISLSKHASDRERSEAGGCICITVLLISVTVCAFI